MTVPSDTVPSDTVPSDTVPSDEIRSARGPADHPVGGPPPRHPSGQGHPFAGTPAPLPDTPCPRTGTTPGVPAPRTGTTPGVPAPPAGGEPTETGW